MIKVRTQRGKPAKDDHRTYEASDIDPRAAGLTIGAVALIVVIVALGVTGLFRAWGAIRQPPSPPPAGVAGPRLQVDERADRAAIEARARARLEGKRGGVPIEQAMRDTAAAGWDAAR